MDRNNSLNNRSGSEKEIPSRFQSQSVLELQRLAGLRGSAVRLLAPLDGIEGKGKPGLQDGAPWSAIVR